MSSSAFPERCRVYRGIVQTFLRRLLENPPEIHVPRLAGLRKPHDGMIFHLHPELFLQDGGATVFCCPEDRFALQAGEIAIVPRGVPHGEIATNRRGSRFHALVCAPNAGEINLIVSVRSPAQARPALALWDRFEGSEAGPLLRYVDDAAAALPQNSPTAAIRQRALLLAALSLMDDMLAPARLAQQTKSHEHPKVRRCHDLIHALLSEPSLSVARLARQLGCTPDHLCRCFRAETGLPVSDYIRHQRIARAKNLLRDPRLNVSEVAWACGFSSPNYFARAFRQATGQPPGRFQQLLVSHR